MILLCQALQEVMQTGHLAASKHGLSFGLPAHTAIVAVASPVGGHLAAAKTLQENVELPPTLLTSFDLIYELKDQQTIHIDKGIAAQGISFEGRSAPPHVIAAHAGLSQRSNRLHASMVPICIPSSVLHGPFCNSQTE